MAGAVDSKNNLIARWGSKQWKVTSQQVKALAAASMNAEYDTSGKKKKLKTEAKVSYPVYKTLMPNVDIAIEIWTWRTLLKKKYALYVGGVALGGYKKYQLVGVDATDIEVVGGQIVHCEIELTFKAMKKSYSLKKTKRKRKKTSKKSSKKKKKK